MGTMSADSVAQVFADPANKNRENNPMHSNRPLGDQGLSGPKNHQFLGFRLANGRYHQGPV
ncbi:hypothetical protein GGE24_002350 [Bradyrhizobium centrosematis]|nr:hypothetical protein [Bradyrhizobium centrosematis]